MTKTHAKDAPILVTGAAGHVGANLTHRLVQDGARVRVLLRNGEPETAFEHIDVEKVYADLRDERSLKAAVEDVQSIFHVASMVSTIDGTPEHRRTIYETNVLGTRYLLRQARAAGVGRTIVTGSFSAVGYDLDRPEIPADEERGFYPYHRAMPYERSKTLQEHEVLKAVAEGQDAMVVTSCAVVGGHDYFPSRMGHTMCRFANRELNAYVPGGFEFVTGRDIAEGHVLAMAKGRPGQKYIIASQFMTLDDIFDVWETMIGQPRPRFKLSPDVLLPLAEAGSWLMTRFRPEAPQLLTPGAIRRLRLMRHADTTKARTELGFRPTSVEEAFAEAYAFHWERGAITHPDAKPPAVPQSIPATSRPAVQIHA
ncbi:MAG: hypothetical protein CMN30_07970 [Sandaracinus sp.]|nr:hypothetical protein [Sandaracinus sp.]|tara:strand:- start:1339 stop:2445 length:1107 start_codon:yes stop_codon:yes gene_type:complete